MGPEHLETMVKGGTSNDRNPAVLLKAARLEPVAQPYPACQGKAQGFRGHYVPPPEKTFDEALIVGNPKQGAIPSTHRYGNALESTVCRGRLRIYGRAQEEVHVGLLEICPQQQGGKGAIGRVHNPCPGRCG